MAREEVKRLLREPLLLAHVKTTLLAVVTLEEGAHHEEPACPPLHLVRAVLSPQRIHLLLEVAEMIAVELKELLKLV